VANGNARAEDDAPSVSFERLGNGPWRGDFYPGRFRFCRACNSPRDDVRGAQREHHLHEAATTGTLWAEAKEVSKNFKVGSYAIEIKDDQGELVAQFQGLAYRKKDRLSFAPPCRAD